MMPRNYSSSAIVLARRNYGEADRIVILLSKDYGKLALLAKGVRRPKSKKRASLEVFSLINFAAVRTKSLDIIIEAELVDSFALIRKDLKRASLAYYFVEVVGRIVQEEQRQEQVYHLLLDYLSKLKTQKNLKSFRLEFVNRLLVAVGFWPKSKKMQEADLVLESVLEREVNSKRVGKQIIS
jgi:DNA repair protein RecO (recombination protein O)